MVNKLINLLVGGAGGFVGLFIANKLAEYMANVKNETLKNNADKISDGLLVVIALVLLMFVKNKWVELLATGIGVVGVADLVNKLVSGIK